MTYCHIRRVGIKKSGFLDAHVQLVEKCGLTVQRKGAESALRCCKTFAVKR